MSGPLNRSMRLQIMGKSSADEHTTEAGTRRKRLTASCKTCRSTKTKCSGESPACARCAEKGIYCSYDADRRNHKVQSLPDETSADSEELQSGLNLTQKTSKRSIEQYSTQHDHQTAECGISEPSPNRLHSDKVGLEMQPDLSDYSW